MASMMIDVSAGHGSSYLDIFCSSNDMFDMDSACDALDDGFWESLPQSPWSPASSMSDYDTAQTLASLDEPQSADVKDIIPVVAAASNTCHHRCDAPSFVASSACDCTCLSRESLLCVNPILRDCMWSATSGLIPLIVPLNSQSSSLASGDSASIGNANAGDSCRVASSADGASHSADSCSICSSCVDQAAMCVDPKTVFPYPPHHQQVPTTMLMKIKCEPEDSPVSAASESTTTICELLKYEHDSETSAYSSAVSDDELEEVDVVSVVTCGADFSNSCYTTSASADQSQSIVRRQMLVLPASESISAQVAAMHNYSSTRCRPTPAAPVLSEPSYNSMITKRCAKRLVGKAASRKRRRVIPAASSSGSESSEDSWATGGDDDDRCRRAQHNVMERRRRHHLKGNFFRLRDVIPDINGDSRVSKVSILVRARDHIAHLSSTESKLKMDYDRLRSIQSRLKWKLSLLQRDQRLGTGCSN